MKNSRKLNYTQNNKEIEQQKKEILLEISNLNKEIKNKKQKKIIFIITTIITIFLLFKIFIGEINLNFPNIANQHKNRLYEIKINDKLTNIGVEETKRTTIIPFLIYSNNFSSHFFYEGSDQNELKFNKGSDVNLSVNSYECYDKKLDVKLSCTSNHQNYKKNLTDDTTYTLRIKRLNKAETITYNDIFVNDISNFFPEKGKYRIFVTGKYKNVTSTIYFDIEII